VKYRSYVFFSLQFTQTNNTRHPARLFFFLLITALTASHAVDPGSIPGRVNFCMAVEAP
jgi:hypothetical protein